MCVICIFRNRRFRSHTSITDWKTCFLTLIEKNTTDFVKNFTELVKNETDFVKHYEKDFTKFFLFFTNSAKVLIYAIHAIHEKREEREKSRRLYSDVY